MLDTDLSSSLCPFPFPSSRSPYSIFYSHPDQLHNSPIEQLPYSYIPISSKDTARWQSLGSKPPTGGSASTSSPFSSGQPNEYFNSTSTIFSSFDCSKARQPCSAAVEIAPLHAQKVLTLFEAVRCNPSSPPSRFNLPPDLLSIPNSSNCPYLKSVNHAK